MQEIYIDDVGTGFPLVLVHGKKSKISYRDVHKSTLTNEVQYFPPQERVY